MRKEDEGAGSARCASRPGHEFWSVSKRQAEQLANYRKRQDSRVSGDEIGWTSLRKKIAGKLVGDGTDARLHVEDRSATKRFLRDAAEPSVIWLVHAEHALGECPKYIWHPPSQPGYGAIVLTQSEYPIVFQYAGSHLLRGRHPNSTENGQFGLDYRPSRSQPFNRGRRFAKEILAGEIYA